MVGLVAVLKIKPGMEAAVAAACLKMAEAVHKHEKDCLLYEPYVPADGSPAVFFLEKYKNMDALAEHRKTAHYLEFRDTIKDALAEPPQVSVLKPLG
ncbi:MAG TPA: putative quinol monooxygenase [Candidatus Limnocylindrales bacterium]|nr:putative quinol monooxygenase [Candidatus Limnocylindrales bacterium]